MEGYGSCDVADIDIGGLLNDIMLLTKQCKVTLPPSVTAVSRGIVTIEGTLSEYIANSNIVDIINDHVMQQERSEERTSEACSGYNDFAR